MSDSSNSGSRLSATEGSEEGRPESGSTKESNQGVGILLAAAALMAAAVAGRSALLADSATDSWQSAIRNEVKQKAAIVEDVRFVYESEAAFALAVAEADIRGQELDDAAEATQGITRSALEVEAFAQQQLARAFTDASKIASDPRYAVEPEGFDLGRRLADVRNENPELVALDPGDQQSDGDELGHQAALEMTAAIPAAVAFLLAALAQAFARARRVLLVGSVVFLVAGLLTVVAVELVVF
jgi:hypothetical protein